MSQELLDTKEVTGRTGIPAETLRYWRHRNEGPPSWKLGKRVVYDAAELQAWINQQRAATLCGDRVA